MAPISSCDSQAGCMRSCGQLGELSPCHASSGRYAGRKGGRSCEGLAETKEHSERESARVPSETLNKHFCLAQGERIRSSALNQKVADRLDGGRRPQRPRTAGAGRHEGTNFNVEESLSIGIVPKVYSHTSCDRRRTYRQHNRRLTHRPIRCH